MVRQTRVSGSQNKQKENPNILATIMKGADVTEFYSPRRVNAMCADYGLQPGSSPDLTNGWDFKMEEHREEAKRRMREEAPRLVIGSPPCITFSNLQAMNPIHKSGDEQAREAYRQIIKEAVQHMEF